MYSKFIYFYFKCFFFLIGTGGLETGGWKECESPWKWWEPNIILQKHSQSYYEATIAVERHYDQAGL